MNKPEVVLQNIAKLGEGPLWDYENNLLYFIDIEGKKIFAYNPEKNEITMEISAHGRVGMVSLCETAGKLVCAIENGLYILDLQTQEFSPFMTDMFKSGEYRFNDGKCGCNGELYIGSMALNGKNDAEFMLIDGKTKHSETILNGVGISNGIAVSPDGKFLYYIDTSSGILRRFNRDKSTGKLSDPETFIDNSGETGGFDGMTIDSDGNLWVAVWGGSCVKKFGADGKLLEKIELPVKNVTSCAFCDSDLSVLYITTAVAGNTQSLAGSVFKYQTDVKGLKCNKFAY